MLLVACGLPVQTKQRSYVLAAGERGGLYWRLGAAIAGQVNDRIGQHGMQCSLLPTEGSVENLDLLSSDKASFALCQADSLQAYLEEHPGAPLRYVCSLYDELLTLVVDAQSALHDLEDFRGRQLGIGPLGSGSRGTALVSLELFDLHRPGDIELEELGMEEALRRIEQGALDGYLASMGHPSPVIAQALASGMALRLLPIKGLRQLWADSPVYHPANIDMDYYPQAQNGGEVQTVGVRCLLLCHEGVEDDVAYAMARVLFEALPMIQIQYPSFRALGHRDLVRDPFGRVHPGAQRYWQEQGLL
jgi:TRAP transporter TAXI family solute receptor